MNAVKQVGAILGERITHDEVKALDSVRAGDARSLDALVEQTYPLVRRFVGRLLRSNEIGEHSDVVQSVMEVVLRSLDRFEGRSKYSTFVYGICFRVVAQRRRAWRVRSFFRKQTESECETAVEAVADDIVAAMRALDCLTHDERATFVLAEAEEMTLDEVGEALHTSARTASRRLTSARRKLLLAVTPCK